MKPDLDLHLRRREAFSRHAGQLDLAALRDGATPLASDPLGYRVLEQTLCRPEPCSWQLPYVQHAALIAVGDERYPAR
jgi:hypothetical protein